MSLICRLFLLVFLVIALYRFVNRSVNEGGCPFSRPCSCSPWEWIFTQNEYNTFLDMRPYPKQKLNTTIIEKGGPKGNGKNKLIWSGELDVCEDG